MKPWGMLVHEVLVFVSLVPLFKQMLIANEDGTDVPSLEVSRLSTCRVHDKTWRG